SLRFAGLLRDLFVTELFAFANPPLDHPARNPDDGRVRRYRLDDDRVRSDAGSLADLDRAEDLRPRADHDARTDRRMSFLAPKRGSAERDPLVDADAVTDLGCFSDHDAHSVIDDDFPELRSGMDVDAGEKARQFRNETRQQRNLQAKEKMGEPMEEDRFHARVEQKDLEETLRCRIIASIIAKELPHPSIFHRKNEKIYRFRLAGTRRRGSRTLPHPSEYAHSQHLRPALAGALSPSARSKK